jgi:hypothetical protein
MDVRLMLEKKLKIIRDETDTDNSAKNDAANRHDKLHSE